MFPEAFMQSTRSFLSRFRPNCQISVSRALWVDKSRQVTKVCVSAAARTNVISAAHPVDHIVDHIVQSRVSCRNLSSNMNGSEPWGEEAPAAVADALPHYAQVLHKTYLLKFICPFLCEGPIVKGFGRGSTELGFPTAYFPDEVMLIK